MTIGETLASARAERGLSVEDIAATTRIRGAIIRAIEADDFAPCGGAVYARGHIRSIAAALGVDAAPLLEEFTHADGEPEPLVNGTIFEVESGKVPPSRNRPRYGFAMAAAALVGVCAVALFSILNRPADGTIAQPDKPKPAATTSAAATSAASTSAPSPSASEPTAAPTDDIAINHSDGVTVRIRIIGPRSWLSATGSDGKRLFYGTLSRGEVKDLADDTAISLVVGAPSATQLIVNGADLGPAGPPGPVAHLVFHPGDPTKQSQG